MNNGIIPVNNLIDRLAIISLFTNISIVAYDYEKVGTSLSIQKNSEQISSSICGKKIELNNNDIIIKNKNNIIGLAGICPFDEFKVSNSTKNALIEIGNYDFRSIRTSMVRLNLSSENGKRLTKSLSN
ncbi:MAG: B3/4 domain-containing protein [Mycoplasmoidaceae bacterium]|nr:B3/4 domain-containing protein [Mycoplasmoidaceae bacterium]